MKKSTIFTLLIIAIYKSFSADSAASAVHDASSSEDASWVRYYVLGHLATKADEMFKPEVKDYIAKDLFPDSWETSLQVSRKVYKEKPLTSFRDGEEGRHTLSCECLIEAVRLRRKAQREDQKDVEDVLREVARVETNYQKEHLLLMVQEEKRRRAG